MNPPRVYTCSQSSTPLPSPSLYHPSGSPQCTSPKQPVSCIESGLAVHFLYDIIHVSMSFSQINPPLPLPQSPKDSSKHLCLFCCLAYISCAFWSPVHVLWRNVYWIVPSFLIWVFFFFNGASWAVCIFCRLILCQFGCKYFVSFCGFSFCFVYDFLCYAKAFKFS